MASNYGGTTHPAWLYNVRANPEVTMFARGHEDRYRGHESNGEERDRLWELAKRLTRGYAQYEGTTEGRTIPVLVFSPVLAGSVARQAHSAPSAKREVTPMVESDRSILRELAESGNADAIDQLVELAAGRGDLDELRRLADLGSLDATDVLVELAGERGDLDELRRLADLGSSDALDVLVELTSD